MGKKERHIVYLGCCQWAGAHYVQFQIEGQDYVYALGSEQEAHDIDWMVVHYGLLWQALNKLKKLVEDGAVTCFKVRPGWPADMRSVKYEPDRKPVATSATVEYKPDKWQEPEDIPTQQLMVFS